MAEIATFGEILPGLLIESVVDVNHPERLLLHTWDGSKANTTPKAAHDAKSYVPAKLPPGIARSVKFPVASKAFKSTRELISGIRSFLSTYVHLNEEGQNLLLAFGLASWFCDVMPVAPVLYLCGSEEAVSQVLRLLACFCRRPALLGDIDSSALSAMPNHMCATLLVNQRRLGRRVRSVLLASQRRHFDLLHGKDRLDLYGAKAFSCEALSRDELVLAVTVPPSRNPLPSLTDLQEQAATRTFQSKLLRYRMLHYETVQNQQIDTGAFVPEMRAEVRSWLAPIVDCPEFADRIRTQTLLQGQATADARFFEPKSVVVEAALFVCHKRGAEHFYVAELAQTANDILRGRHEEPALSDKRVGSLLRELGIYGTRVAAGYRITLTQILRRRVHELAADYAVPTLDNANTQCDDCRKLIVL
jgi:hypothetical protein